jgi:argininosuccinate synthase
MSSEFGAYGEINKSYAGRDVVGFTKVIANPLKIYYSVNASIDE